MTFEVRQACKDDGAEMSALINPIIAMGGSTAHQSCFDAARMISHYIAPELSISCLVAKRGGQVLGFQALEWCDPDWPGEDILPTDWAVIATFVSNTARGQGVGRAIFDETVKVARASDVITIDATIRADNALGLAYYAALGFTDYGRLQDVPLRDGTRVDRIRKRFDL